MADTESDGGYRIYCIAWFGGVDGPFVALLAQAIHSPRVDDIYDGKWRNI